MYSGQPWHPTDERDESESDVIDEADTDERSAPDTDELDDPDEENEHWQSTLL